MNGDGNNSGISTLSDWLLEEARLERDSGAHDLAVVERLLAAGLPLVRVTTGVPSLHPQVNSFSFLWHRDQGSTVREFSATDWQRPGITQSPIVKAYDTGADQRHRLYLPPPPDEYSLLTDFRAEGLTDYLVLALPFSDGSFKAVSFATDRATGFSDAEIALLEGLRPALAASLETQYLRRQLATLMDTYVGPAAGNRVLSGDIRRGTGETIQAVIWFCDIRGFTSLSEALPAQSLIDMLNHYFEAVTDAVEAEGGETLKFIGDAVLAIFRLESENDGSAANSALVAARAALEALSRTNLIRSDAGLPPIECGIALHPGAVVYGNIGGRSRLDFTVIGPAVNKASRIEAMTRQLGHNLLVSEDFARLSDTSFKDLGRFELKGLEGSHTLFAPAEIREQPESTSNG